MTAEVMVVRTPSLGDRSYLAHDGAAAFAVDPQRDIDRMLDAARDRGVRITHVLETHLHNDYLTGGLALARATGAEYVLAADEQVAYPRTPAADGDLLHIGSMRVEAMATPGHTFHHLAYVLRAPGRAPAVFTGGSLLYGSTGRPDLLGTEHTEELARAQQRSARRLADALPAETEIYPTHGFGGFCSAGQSRAESSTLGAEARHNPVLTTDPDTWVRDLLEGLDAYPAYYARMAPANAAGPQASDLGPVAQAEAPDVAARIADGEWVVDLRSGRAFAREHARGSLNFGLDGSLATYLGWLLEPGTPVTLVGASADEVDQARREISRVGVDRPAATAHGPVGRWGGRAGLVSYPVASFADLLLVRRHRRVVVLDVRSHTEWRERQLPDAVHIPLHELPARLPDLPEGEVWVHCSTGYRSAIAASLLHASGRAVVLVDDAFDRVPDAELRQPSAAPGPAPSPAHRSTP